MIQRLVETHTRHCLFLAWYAPDFSTAYTSHLPHVAYQSKNATEADLRKEFEVYGRIEQIRLVKNKRNHSRGYAFIVYEREKDMKGKCAALHSNCTHANTRII